MGKKKKKREEPEGPPGAPEWVVTFTDMISLLVTFFVLMMTFSSLDAHDVLKIDALLEATTGIHESSSHNALAEVGQEDQISATSLQRGAMTPHSRPPDELPDSLEEMGQKQTEEHRAVDLENVSDGLVIEFGAEECFDPGSTKISPPLAKSLEELGSVLEHYPHLIVVEGFTDGAFRSNAQHPSPDSLSLARANTAARFMLDHSEMRRELIQVAGHGAEQPRAENDDPSGRRLNRRIQIRVLSLSKARANYYETQKSKRRAG